MALSVQVLACIFKLFAVMNDATVCLIEFNERLFIGGRGIDFHRFDAIRMCLKGTFSIATS